jgi:hypothetical protein
MCAQWLGARVGALERVRKSLDESADTVSVL